MGLGDHGNHPAPLAQSQCPGARVRGSDHDFLPLIVSSGAHIEAQFDLIGVCASDRGEPVRLCEERRGLKGEEFAVGPKGLPGCIMPESDHDTDLYRLRTT
jgi:hypothetical protein